MVQFRIRDKVIKSPARFESVVSALSNDAQAFNERLLEPGAEIRACDDAWRYYSAHLEAKDLPVKIRPCEIYHADC